MNSSSIRNVVVYFTYGIYIISILGLLSQDLFNPQIKDWIIKHLGIIGVSGFFLCISYWLGLTSKEDFKFKKSDILNSNFVVITAIILGNSLTSTTFREELNKDYTNDITSMILISPTLLFIIGCFFHRSIRIEKMLKETTKKEDDL